MGFFDSLWGWADYEPKHWDEAAYKDAHASSGALANFFALFWGWADSEPKNWADRPSAISYGWFG